MSPNISHRNYRRQSMFPKPAPPNLQAYRTNPGRVFVIPISSKDHRLKYLRYRPDSNLRIEPRQTCSICTRDSSFRKIIQQFDRSRTMFSAETIQRVTIVQGLINSFSSTFSYFMPKRTRKPLDYQIIFRYPVL